MLNFEEEILSPAEMDSLSMKQSILFDEIVFQNNQGYLRIECCIILTSYR